MIDTIRLGFPVAPTEEQLKKWDRHIRTRPTGQTIFKYTLNLKLTLDAVSVRCTHYPLDYSGKPLTTVEFSLPKLVFGNNFTMLSSLEPAIERANALLATIDALPDLDISKGILLRLDLCHNHQVGPLVPDYINAIGHLEYPHRRTKHHKDEGVEFRAKHTTTKFYNKERECGDPRAHGILRQETSYLNPKRIAKLLGRRKPTLLDVTPDVVAQLLRNDLAKLHLDGNIIADRHTALERLCAEHGPLAGYCYWGLLQHKNDASRRQIRSRIGLHPRSLDRTLKRITDAGLVLTLTDTNEPLPPLEINL
jgi:hypothetical protein